MANIFLVVILLVLFTLYLSNLGIQMTKKFDSTNHQSDILISKMKKETKNNVSYILLWTQIRSGSRFTAELITLNFDVYYVEEPVSDLYLSGTNNSEQINVSSFLKNILNCNYSQYPGYTKLKMEFFRIYNKDVGSMKRMERFSADQIQKLDEALCHSSGNRLSRIVLPSLDVIEPLLNDPKMKNIRIVMLIRDPRAIWSSKENLNEKIWIYGTDPCVKQRNDIFWLDKFSKKGFNKYEDLARQPFAVTKNLYKFLEFPYTIYTQNYIKQHTQFDPSPNYNYGTHRKSISRVSRWRYQLDYGEMKKIQDRCEDVLKRMNYRIFNTKEEYENHSISVLIN